MNILTDSLIRILEHPHIEKGYKEFKKYLESVGRTEDAEALAYLLKIKFPHDTDHSNPN
jgi:hypothetical protein